MEDQAADLRAIEELVAAAFVAAWNRYDAAAYARTFAADADFTTVSGVQLHGRAEIEELHARRFATMFAESVAGVTSVATRFLRNDVALVAMEWSLRGHRYYDDTPRPPVAVLATVVATRDDGAWAIAALHNMVLPANVAELRAREVATRQRDGGTP
jgi:uncharacterized protein (TIGR02246 family)